ncbi:MAG: FAD-dependent oxidoreductase [Chloroflexota bacterium]|nr:FAD-dependent oxidoreductase [Chloroflexota bacterium]MDE2945819.1 FAD-dependent oxidoreductase [Chloroflexota bacterium]
MAVDVIIVGAGLSGLMAAQTLRERGHSVQVFDKGRSVGGRLATRRVGENGLVDHGAQFFTVRGAALQRYVDRWRALDLVYVWGTGWSDGSLKRTAGDGHPRYAVRGGMNKLAKHLAVDVNVTVDRLVTAVNPTDGGWTLVDSAGETAGGRGLLMTPPMPETLELLSDSGVHLQPEDFAELRRIRFGPCLCGIHEIDGDVDLPEPGAMQNFQSDVYWVADNRAKGISGARIITSHANAKFSRQNWDASEADIIRALESAVSPFLKPGARIARTQLKKWRYSVPLTTHAQEYLLAKELPPLVFAGDAFGGRGRVEGAFMSGLAAGEAMHDALSSSE